MSDRKFTIGLDFGTNSVRALIVDVSTGEEVATSVANYSRGDAGVILDKRDPQLARQHPQEYVDGTVACVTDCLKQFRALPGVSADDVIGVGVDTTGSTPLPVDASGVPLAFEDPFKDHPSAFAWLWKDHTSFAEAQEITEKAARLRPHYLGKVGGTYSSEWFWSKVLHCRRAAPKVFDAAYTWVECADWIPGILTGTSHPTKIKRCICAAGHKGLFNPSWGGYPDEEFLAAVDPALVRIRKTLPDKAYNVADPAGGLTPEWAGKLGLPRGIPVAVAAFDAHLGAVGMGIQPGVFAKIIGTSGCDMMVWPIKKPLADVPGLCGTVPESILPGYYGLEAGQSAVGDLFNWFVNYIQPHGSPAGSHEALTTLAEKIKPGESGLLALDWLNGNRTVLVDQRLTGLIVGLTLHTTPAEIYRALIEATAFGARIIMERFEEYRLKVKRIVNCGGIAAKNPLVMQIYADAIGRPMEISRSSQTCALGAAIAASVVAGKKAGGHADFEEAVKAMTAVEPKVFKPLPENTRTYNSLFALYKRLHDAFGTREYSENLYSVMKQLLDIRDKVRA